MARSREPVKPVESQSESGEEEDEEVSSEEVDSEPEPEQTQTATQKKSQPQLAAKSQQQPPPQQMPSSSEEEESGSESESESDGPDSDARPLASKPMEEVQKSRDGDRKARSKPNAPEPVTPTKSAAAKRPAEDTATKDSKKSKKTTEPETSKKKSLFQRLWSQDDEIAILKGMIDYTSKNKSDPISELNAFQEFIKKNLHIDFTRTQLLDKIRRLKKKYENNKSKEKEGKERTFSKSHEQNAYDLSKLIWGSGKEYRGAKVVGSPKGNGSVVRKTATKKVNAAESEDAKDVKNAVVLGGEGEKSPAKRLNSNSVGATIEERMLIAGGEYFGLGQGLEGERDWQKLRVEELQLYQKQLEVRLAQTKLVLGVMKGRDH